MTITQTEYGQYAHGTPEHKGHGTWRRWDDWTSKDGEKGGDSLFCAGPHDDSPIHLGRYGFKCSCCYLGFAHTSALHNTCENS